MAELSIGGTPLANQRIASADGARAPAVGTDPNSTKQSTGNETSTFQRLSATEKATLDVLSDIRQKGSELRNIYEKEQTIQNRQGNPTARVLDENNKKEAGKNVVVDDGIKTFFKKLSMRNLHNKIENRNTNSNRDDMIAAKKVSGGDVSHVIKRERADEISQGMRGWESGNRYHEYDDSFILSFREPPSAHIVAIWLYSFKRSIW